MKSISFSILLVLIFIILASCKKDSVKEELNPKDILTSHGWKIISRTKNGAEQSVTDCDKGDCWTYLTDGNLQVQHGNLVCYPNGPNTVIYCVWALADDKKTLTKTIDSTIWSGEISFSGDNLIITYQVTFMTDIYIYIETYTPC